MRELIDTLPPPVLLAVVLAAASAVVIAAGAAVVELLDEVMGGPAAGRPDERLAAWVRDRRSAGLTRFFGGATRLADGEVAAAVVTVTAIVLAVRRRVALAVAVVASSAGAAAITFLVKEVVGRARPPQVARLVEAAGDAFPSGHSSQAVACYGALALVVAVTSSRPAVRVAAPVVGLVIALVVGVSRVYLGVHWPSDVLSGWIVGLAWLTAVTAVAWTLWRVDRPHGWWRRSPP